MAVRVTQIPVETSVSPDTGKVRVTQIPVEASVAPDTGQVRVTQVVIETSILHVIPDFNSWPIFPQPNRVKKYYAALYQSSTMPIVAVRRKKPNVFIIT